MVVVESNFEFLKIDYDTEELFQTANRAEENYTYGDYEGVLTKVRKLAENLTHMVADQEYLDVDGMRFVKALKVIESKITSKTILDVFHQLRGFGNSSSHTLNPEDATKENAYKALNRIHKLLAWYMLKYVDPDIKEEAISRFLEPKAEQRYQAAERKFIYIQNVDNETGLFQAYEGNQKIGEGTISEDDIEADLTPNSHFLRAVAPKRIGQYMTTAGLKYDLGWVELAYRKSDKKWFHDHDVHAVLERSGVKHAKHLTGNEWFEVDLETAKEAIKAVKEGQHYLPNYQIPSQSKEILDNRIVLRPEQKNAVEQTQKIFKKKKKMLWNAKMRFGKTISTLELIKEAGFEKVLIMTHRPVVSDSWFKDFNKVDMASKGYRFGSRQEGETIETLKNGDNPFVYFASIQLLRYDSGNANLKDFEDVDWDLIVIDEAHEGTQTDLSHTVLEHLEKKDTKILELSGTPFNILDQYEEDQVFTWDYTMEQEAKLRWALERPNEKNPYEDLPKVNMFTFEMKQKEFIDESKSFNFREFFKVDENGELVYKNQVRAFLDNITNEDKVNNYPFSTQAYRDELRHTLWLMPGVKEANAFEKLLNEHPIFGSEYRIVNVVRNGDCQDGLASQDDLDKVRSAITDDPSQTKTITLTVRKLTTGVNIKEWTAVIFLSNTNSPMNYLQAAFRAQTPFSHEKLGMKKNCYIFDFAPDRALTVMSESAQINSGVGKKNTAEQKQAMTKLLNFMPILGNTGNGMKTFNVDRMLTQLKKVYAEKAVRSGFEDDSLYNDNLLTLTADDATLFNDLKGIVGQTGKSGKNVITVNDQGLTDEEYDIGEKARKKPARQRTEEEKEAIDKINEAKKQRKIMISILRGVSIRIPMMIYGMKVDLDRDISIKDFTNQVDDQSWKEFMPKGFTKAMFREITQYYDQEVFIEAGRIIRQRAKSFDKLDFIDRAQNIAELFGTFKNPDKETVLTPWRVVNLQLIKTLGGLNFFDDDFKDTTSDGKPSLHWVDKEITQEVYQKDHKFLDINAKTGLYPLHVAMSLYYKAISENDDNHFEADQVYRDILKNNIYAIAKTPMAKTITERTLAGYRDFDMNVEYIDGFETIIKDSTEKGKEKVEEVFEKVKFDVVVGNPPYQEDTNNNRDTPIYHHFMETAYKVSKKVVLITPARFLFNVGQTPSTWNKKMLNDVHLKVIYYVQKSSEVFPNTDIKGGVAVTFRNEDREYGAIEQFISIPVLNDILHKVLIDNHFMSLNVLHFGNSTYKLTSRVYEDYPEYKDKVSKAEQYSVGSNVFIRFPNIFSEDKKTNDDIQIYGRLNNNRTYRWIKREYIANHPNLDKYKVFIPGANGSGALGEVLSTPLIGEPLIGEPLIGHTQTFISFGAFDNKIEAENLLKYVKTKFARVMLGTLKITQNNKTKEVWKNVPLQDFTDASDIDWSKSIPEIDQQLYAKYGLSDEEIKFIEEKVKPME